MGLDHGITEVKAHAELYIFTLHILIRNQQACGLSSIFRICIILN